MKISRTVIAIGMVSGTCLVIGNAYPSPPGPGVLRAEFVYDNGLTTNPLTKDKCKPKEQRGGPAAAIAVDLAVNAVGAITESLIDAASARTQPEATTLEAVVPLEGFYFPKGTVVDYGCLVLHNGENENASDASLLGIFQLHTSDDGSAFRFDVVEWKFSRFLQPNSSHWFQDSDTRDFALKIEFLSPGADGLGSRRVFFERSFTAVTEHTLSRAFNKDQKLPWLTTPPPPATPMTGRSLPLNIAITAVETTKPNQFALWIQQIAKDKKTDLSTLIKDETRRQIDPGFAATQNVKSAGEAAKAFDDYKSAWDTWNNQRSLKPVEPTSSSDAKAKTIYEASLATWKAGMLSNQRITEAKRVIARSAFANSGISWPGDLPSISE